jgi:hypothetical protein
MMNYGGLLLVDKHGMVKEWDTAQQKWSPGARGVDRWIEHVLDDGDQYLNDQ